MNQSQKWIVAGLWLLALVALGGVLALKYAAARRQKVVDPNTVAISPDPFANVPSEKPVTTAADIPIEFAAPGFTRIDQNNQPFSNTDLRGHPYIADFIYTTCASICPLMSHHMELLQDQLPEQVKLVSFSVDPEHDTPAALLAYARDYHAERGRWIFLTGDLKTQTQIVNGMHQFFHPAELDTPIVHSPFFVLVDADGNVRGNYDSNQPGEIERLTRDANLLNGAVPTTQSAGANP